VRIPSWLFLFEHHAKSVHGGYESFPKTLEGTRNSVLHLFGRHSPFGLLSKRGQQASGTHGQRPYLSWVQNQLKKEHIAISAGDTTLGVYFQPKGRIFGSQFPKDKTSQKRVGKSGNISLHDYKENGSHFGPGKESVGGIALPKGIHRPTLQFCTTRPTKRLEFCTQNIPSFENATQRNQSFTRQLEREALLPKTSKGAIFRCIRSGLGGGVNPSTGEMVQIFWREKALLHINVKEGEAAINRVQSLPKQGENVQLVVDNTTAYWYLVKGGESPTSTKSRGPFSNGA
jgi:hypothetical protein